MLTPLNKWAKEGPPRRCPSPRPSMAGPSLTPSSSGLFNVPSGQDEVFCLEGESSKGLKPTLDGVELAEAAAAAAEADAAIDKLNALLGPLPDTRFGREVRSGRGDAGWAPN